MRTDHHAVGIVWRTDHPAVGIKRQLRLNSSLPHRLVKIETEEFGVTRTTSGKFWTIEQDIQDRSTDREGVPRGMTTATYSDVINLTTPGPNTADGLHQSYATTRRDIEAPHTLSASQMKYWITNSPRGSSLSTLNYTTTQPILQYGTRISFSISIWLEEMTSAPSNTSH